VLEHPGFAAGEYDTGFLDRERDSLKSPSADGELLDVGMIAAAIRLAGEAGVRVDDSGGEPAGPQPIPPWRTGRCGWG
jgi:hypothetical protein